MNANGLNHDFGTGDYSGGINNIQLVVGVNESDCSGGGGGDGSGDGSSSSGGHRSE
jgi:hypothetical protein